MAWIIGIDEAGYGPNLGPFVMTSVACRVPEPCHDADLWHLLRPAVRRGTDADEGRLLIDDSKIVYTARGLAGLEHGVLAALWRDGAERAASLASFVDWACPDDRDELVCEAWYRGVQVLPVHVAPDELGAGIARFDTVCAEAEVGCWHVRSVIVCPRRFNALLDASGTKGAILAHALANLLRCQRARLTGDEPLSFFIDKHGGRNTYAAMLQHAFPDGMVFAVQEGMARSVYRVHGLDREVRLTFQPRADTEHFCVALASMTSKYLRELLMLEFNRFWQQHVPGLKPTAGYPGDAARFFEAIRQAIAALGLREEAVWRKR
jgi:ribonuclease HII